MTGDESFDLEAARHALQTDMTIDIITTGARSGRDGPLLPATGWPTSSSIPNSSSVSRSPPQLRSPIVEVEFTGDFVGLNHPRRSDA